MAYKVQLETTSKQIVELPLVQIGTARMVELEDGRLADFDDPSNYSKYGLEKWIKTIAVPDPLPEPFDPIRAEAIQELRAALLRYPGDEYRALLNRNAKMRNSIDRDFPSVSLEKIQEWTALVESEAERIKEERKRAEPPPTFSQFQLSQHFYHSQADLGNLKIVSPDPLVRGTRENGWVSEWLGKCKVCGFEGPVTATTLLLIKCKDLPPHKCGAPCR